MPRLQRCTAITTGSESSPRTNNETSESGFQSCRRNAGAGAKEEEEDDLEAEEERLDDLLPKTIKRSKPFKYVYEKEIVMYAYFKVSATIPSLASLSGDKVSRRNAHLRGGLDRNSTTTRPSASTLRRPTAATPAPSSKTSKPSARAPSSTSCASFPTPLSLPLMKRIPAPAHEL